MVLVKGKGEKPSLVHLVNGTVNYVSYLYRGVDSGRNDEGSREEKKRSNRAKASTQLATSSLMKAVAAAIQ